MNLLAIDTSTTTASAAIVSADSENGGYILRAEASVTQASLRAGRRTHSETLLPMVEGLFTHTALRLADMDFFACTCGPGSFTGLRIGAATAKGLAFASGKPLVQVSTLDALAYTTVDLLASPFWAVPLLDARRSQVYGAVYRNGEQATDYLAEPLTDLLARLARLLAEAADEPRRHVIFLGDGAKLHRARIAAEAWPAGTTLAFAPACHSQPRAACVGGLALAMAQAGQYGDEQDFTLTYLRKPQAQRLAEGESC